MEPKPPKLNARRSPEESENSSACRSTRLLPPSGTSLADRVSDYYEKLMKNSQKRELSKDEEHFGAVGGFHHTFAGTGTGSSHDAPVSLSRHSQPSTSMAPGRMDARNLPMKSMHPYTVYFEDPFGALQQYQRKKSPPLNPEKCDAHHDAVSSPRNVKSRSKSPFSIPDASKTPCSLCQNLAHSPRSCTARGKGTIEQKVNVAGTFLSHSPLTHHSRGCEDDLSFSDGYFEKHNRDFQNNSDPVPSGSRKREVPAGITVRCERDVIGQERSPVSKAQPSVSVLSTSSSNGDSVPRERKKWVRPPLVGQAASSNDQPLLIGTPAFDCPADEDVNVSRFTDKRKNTSDSMQLSSSTGSEQNDSRPIPKGFNQKSSFFDSSSDGPGGLNKSRGEYSTSKDGETGTAGGAGAQQMTSEGEQGLSDSCAGRVSPSSSVTSSRRLEWDSGADVGYNQDFGGSNPDVDSAGLCSIERMALAQGCSVALCLRLDPEGTTVPSKSLGPIPAPVLPSPIQNKTIATVIGKPSAESTPVEKPNMLPKSVIRAKTEQKSGISPISHSSDSVNPVRLILSHKPPVEVDDVKASEDEKVNEPPIQPVTRQFSNSMQDLSKCAIKRSNPQLYRSQSDPDLSAEVPTLVEKSWEIKYPSIREMPRNQNWVESNVAVHSVSSGSDATLVHVDIEHDVVGPKDDVRGEDGVQKQRPKPQFQSGETSVQANRGPSTSKSRDPPLKQVTRHFSEHEERLQCAEDNRRENPTSQAPNPPDSVMESQSKSTSKKHVCSDTDHRKGLHHHFGVLCSTVLGGHIPTNVQPNVGSQAQNVLGGSDRVYASVEDQDDEESGGRQKGAGSPAPQAESEALAADSAASSAFLSDAAHEENAMSGNTLAMTGRANSFEYLPGHMYETSNTGAGSGCKVHQQPPGISTSTETDSEPPRSRSRVIHRKIADSSSHDTEEDRLWGSPQPGSNTLVHDLERGVSLLKGVMESKSSSRHCKREIIRRVIRKLVSSEYVDDVLERERARFRTRSPFSPRRTRHGEWRSKRAAGVERQELSGESDEQKHHFHNSRKRLYMPASAPTSAPAPVPCSTAASGSKSSSLWSSQAESASGSVSLSTSSEPQKQSKASVKPNPLYKPPAHTQRCAQQQEWMEPATQSEKLLLKQKQDSEHKLVDNTNEEITPNPVSGFLRANPQKQLLWVKNEINHLKMLKQLLQKQETEKLKIDPHTRGIAVTAMPVTAMKQPRKVADCTSPDVPEALSPKLGNSRQQQWTSLDSDTSALSGACQQFKNSASSQDSHWHEVEVANTGEQDNRPHRTVSISDADNITDGSGSVTQRKTGSSQGSFERDGQRTKRRSVNISDDIQSVGHFTQAALQRKRSERLGEGSEGRTYSSRALTSKGPFNSAHQEPQLNLQPGPSSIETRRPASLFIDKTNEKHDTESGVLQRRTVLEDLTVKAKTVHPSNFDQSNQQGRSGTSGGSSTVDRSACIQPSSQASELSNKRPTQARVRVHVEQTNNSSISNANSSNSTVQHSMDSDRTSETDKRSIRRPASDDSITKAVTEAVTSKVKALQNMGQIEEAEVNIRVKMGQKTDDIASASAQTNSARLWKTQDLDDDHSTMLGSKSGEMDDMIARQAAMDCETQQKLLSIAESRQRAGQADVDRRIHELLLQDYLSRHPLKTVEGQSPARARLDIRIDTPGKAGVSSHDVGVQEAGTKKPLRTRDVYTNTTHPEPHTANKPYKTQDPRKQEYENECVCGKGPKQQSSDPVQPVSRPQTSARPHTAPADCVCSCRSRSLNSSRWSYQSTSQQSSPRHHPDMRRRFEPLNVHEILKSRNVAYFLQFEEDENIKLDDEEVSQPKQKSLEVVTVKVPKHKPRRDIQVKDDAAAQNGTKKTKLKGSSQAKGGKSGLSTFGKKLSLKREKTGDPQRSLPRGEENSAWGTADKNTSSLKGEQKMHNLGYQLGNNSNAWSSFSEMETPSSKALSPAEEESSARSSYSRMEKESVKSSDQGLTGYRSFDFLKSRRKETSVSDHTQSPCLCDCSGFPNACICKQVRGRSHSLRKTPGRCRLSMSATNTSPDGNSGTSSLNVAYAKHRRSPRTPTRRGIFVAEKDGSGGKGMRMDGKVFQTMAFNAATSESLSSSVSELNSYRRSQGNRQPVQDGGSVSVSDQNGGDLAGGVPTLQEYLEHNYPQYLNAAEKRRRCIAEMAYLRRLRQESRKRLLELEGDSWKMRQKMQRRSTPKPRPVVRRKISPRKARSITAKKLMNLPEVQQRMADLKRKEEHRTNRLMAEIYTRKLQEKVLRGSTTLRSSISVISNI